MSIQRAGERKEGMERQLYAKSVEILCEKQLKADGLFWKVNGRSRGCWFLFNEEKETNKETFKVALWPSRQGLEPREHAACWLRAANTLDVGWAPKF